MESLAVKHRHYGLGFTQLPRKGGFEWQVRFENGTHKWIRRDHLEFLDQVVKRRADGESMADERKPNFQQRRIVENLRLGIVPDEGVALYTVGREDEIGQLANWLHSPNEPGRALIGSYGAGKTHLLRHFYQYALDQGYAVSFTEMDPQERPFSKPKRVYSQIVENLRWRNETGICGFRDLVQDALRAGLLRDNIYFQHLRGANDKVWHWIEGRETTVRPYSPYNEFRYLPGLYDYTTAANVYCYLLSTLGWLTKQPAFGLKGLLLVFDEAEIITWATSVGGREKGLNFIDALLMTAYEDEGMLFDPEDTGMIFARHARDVPFLYRGDCGLKMLFAFTDTWALSWSAELRALGTTSLPSLDSSLLVELVNKVAKLYAEAYEMELSDTMVGSAAERIIDDCPTRTRVKGTIEALDISRFGNMEP